MANELTLGMSMAYDDGTASDELVVTGLAATSAAPAVCRSPNLLASFTVDTAIPLGGVTTPRYLAIKNLDSTNFVTVKDASGGNIIAKVLAGKCGLIPLPAAAAAPYLRADTGNVKCDVLIS